MSAVPELQIDLNQPPSRRWEPLRGWVEEARLLLDSYARDLGAYAPQAERLAGWAEQWIEPERREELHAVAAITGVAPQRVTAGNLYYDALKLVWGCTAFAVETPEGPLHARNLDWWTEEERLARFSMVVNYHRAGKLQYRVVGWPGYVGALSGVAPGRFAVTLNAVISPDAPVLATPISLLLRTVLEEARDYAEAVRLLAETPITSDCLLLVTGTQNHERVVIERTPTRHALRGPTAEGRLVVTNSYQALDLPEVSGVADALIASSCGRFGRAMELVSGRAPSTAEECFRVLTDPAIRMGITVQHMVFSAARGTADVRIPAPSQASSW